MEFILFHDLIASGEGGGGIYSSIWRSYTLLHERYCNYYFYAKFCEVEVDRSCYF